MLQVKGRPATLGIGTFVSAVIVLPPYKRWQTGRDPVYHPSAESGGVSPSFIVHLL